MHIRPDDNDDMFVPTIENVISCAHFCCSMELNKIGPHARNSEYNPMGFTALIMRIRDPKTTSLLFKSGKMICTGAKTEKQSLMAARKHARIYQRFIPEAVQFQSFNIENIVASWNVGFKLYLTKVEDYGKRDPQVDISFNPEAFPGLYYKWKKYKLTLSIFDSGKVNITGAKDTTTICKALEEIFGLFLECYRPS